METTFADLQKLPLTKLKEYALSIGGIHGVHSMKKVQLLASICEVKGITDTSKIEAAKRREIARGKIHTMKKEARSMRKERAEKQESLSRHERDVYRKKIKQLKRSTRKLSHV